MDYLNLAADLLCQATRHDTAVLRTLDEPPASNPLVTARLELTQDELMDVTAAALQQLTMLRVDSQARRNWQNILVKCRALLEAV